MQERRDFVKGLAAGCMGVFGVPELVYGVDADRRTPGGVKGVLVFYVNVGTLDHARINTYVSGLKETLGDKSDGWERLIVPVRPPERTRVEVFFADHDHGKAEKLVAELRNLEVLPKRPDDYWKKLKNDCQDYALLMNGAPVVKVDLSQEHLDLCFDKTMAFVDDVCRQEQNVSVYLWNHIPVDGMKSMTYCYSAMFIAGTKQQRGTSYSENKELKTARDLLYEVRTEIRNYFENESKT